MEKNKYNYYKTIFDDRKGLICGDHPHAGAVATCLGCDSTHAGPGLIFKNDNSDETFFVFKPIHVKWIS